MKMIPVPKAKKRSRQRRKRRSRKILVAQSELTKTTILMTSRLRAVGSLAGGQSSRLATILRSQKKNVLLEEARKSSLSRHRHPIDGHRSVLSTCSERSILQHWSTRLSNTSMVIYFIRESISISLLTLQNDFSLAVLETSLDK